jgi:16S rRNA G966 N2-methylase RsmD
VTFSERDPRAAALIARNAAACGAEGRYTIERGDVALVLRRSQDRGFDLILLDPPYEYTDIAGVLSAAADRLDANGLVVLERATRRQPDVPPALVRTRDVKSGDSTLTFLARHE